MAASHKPSHAAPTRVLVVDDDPEYRLSVRGVLEKHGYEVHEADNGLAALESCRAIVPSIILLDVAMPQMNGAEFLNAKQADPKIAFIPVVVVSSSDIGVGARVVRQLRKPVSADVLTSIIRVVVGVWRRSSVER